jgi:hypothetical protein
MSRTDTPEDWTELLDLLRMPENESFVKQLLRRVCKEPGEIVDISKKTAAAKFIIQNLELFQ